MAKISGICFLDMDKGRDPEIVMPIVYFAETYLNCKIKFEFVWDLFTIYIKRPSLVILPNTVGSKWYFEISKYANKSGCIVFALISEGNLTVQSNYWGFNIDRKFYQDYLCLWSSRTFEYFINEFKKDKSKLAVTGAVGFDRYIINKYIDKREFLKRFNFEKYEKVISYAGWAFGKLYNETGVREIEGVHGKKNILRKKWMIKEQLNVESILKKTINDNKDILFILKQHPNETHPHISKISPNEIVRLREIENVLFISDELDIHDAISISDLWFGYETTTAIEAWMMGTETIMINPSSQQKTKIQNASIRIENIGRLQDVINEYYNNDMIECFYSTDKMKLRDETIASSIGIGDGNNHIRAGLLLADSIISSSCLRKKRKFRFVFLLRYILIRIGNVFYNKALFSFLPKFRKTIWIFENNRLENIARLKEGNYKYLDAYHNNLRNKYL
jgi:hypothetical protein